MKFPRKLLMRTLVAAAAVGTIPAQADVVADWQTVSTSISGERTFSFAQYDITRNFTDLYSFTLEGSSDATYMVNFNFDYCRNGCGNPDLSYGIYAASGSLVSPINGTVALSPGNYVFQVKGTGFGAGTSVDYFGSVTFSFANSPIVSPVPEPGMLLLTLPGLAVVLLAARRRNPLSAQVNA